MKVITMNRKDNLENFIWKNREKLDSDSPSNNLWNKIDSELNKPPEKDPQKPIFKYGRWIVIALIVLVSTAFAFFQMGSKQGAQKAMLFAEIQNIENHYERQTHQLIKAVGYDNDILQMPDIEDIDTHIAEIKGELDVLPKESEEKALQALMESYETKLMILKSIMKNYEIAKPKNNASEYNI